MYAQVVNGTVARTWAAIPSRFDNIMAFHLMSVDERKARGFHQCVDQRPVLAEGHSYGPDQFTWNGTDVLWTAADVPPTQDYLDRKTAREYAPLVALREMTPAQTIAWVNANITDEPSQKAAIRTLAVAVGILSRQV